MNQKRILALLLVLVLTLVAFVGCSGPAPAGNEGEAEETGQEADQGTDEKIKVGVSIANFDDTFLMYMKDGMDAFAKTLGSEVDVTYVDANEDAPRQLNQVENFISQGMDAIIVVPVNTQATEPMSNAAVAAGIPLVYVNRVPDYLPEGTTFVGSESIDAGIFQMEYLAEKLDGKGNVVIMQGRLDNEASQKRTEGVQEVAAKHPEINITKVQTANWSREEGMTLMENWLSSGDQIDAVASNNDDMALGAIMAIEAAGLLGEILVGGVDATPDAIAQVEAGKLDVTVFQDANGQGGGAMEAAVNLAKGNAVDQYVWIPFQLVTPENYQDFK
ncbi:monosaccharide ABC transporter substrate-binding protein, CUT2 family [Anaerovirgula multivorans]|uniref:Monosaccharide ABC transporter substrate-binding protein, CUT2 family n=1 Tax=Anaerovirgula multivorans TaxID=312168 RepID=A0A239AQ33_9FIRM|nr:sugar ABC transporter substrate-binding protein [Anaerovirgula multivorans]SNR97650.1 monosaccharide ABC transporter substrate-binding protein, CUT2 family [Anaerovirgula multivorans]